MDDLSYTPYFHARENAVELERRQKLGLGLDEFDTLPSLLCSCGKCHLKKTEDFESSSDE